MQHGKLDVVETISALLARNEENQREFRAMDGYAILQGLLEAVAAAAARPPADPARAGAAADDDGMVEDGKGADAFVQSCSSIFFTIALDGNRDMVRTCARPT